MEQPTPSGPSAPPRKRPRRWPRRLLIAFVLCVAALGVGALFVIWTASSELDKLLADMDLLDPGWRLEEIEAKRKQLPDANNSAAHILTIINLRGGQSVLTPAMETTFDNLPPQVQLNEQQTRHLDKRFEALRKAVVEARKLQGMPVGRFPLTYTADFFGTTASMLINYQNVREVCELLKWDAARRVDAADADGAMDSCLALYHAGRSLGDEPFLITLLVRCACNAIAVEAVERTLAQGHFSDASEPCLKRMQTALAKELQEPALLQALRGERAGSHQYFQALAEGKATGASLLDRVVDYFHHQHADQLRFYNEALETLKLPSEKWVESFEALEKKAKSNSLLAANTMPAVQQVAKAELRTEANLRCAVAALAAERFRLAQKRWPESLEALVKAGFLDAVPADPFDGKPLRLKRTADGLVIYSVGFDRIDNGGNLERDHPMQPGTDLGFRLWDDERRRQPPIADGGTAEP